jgi:hypothetical protein
MWTQNEAPQCNWNPNASFLIPSGVTHCFFSGFRKYKTVHAICQTFLCYLHASLVLMSIYSTRKPNVEQKYQWITPWHSTQNLPGRSSLSESRKVSRYTRKFSSTSIYFHKDTMAFPEQIISKITKTKLYYIQISYRFQTHGQQLREVRINIHLRSCAQFH